MENVTKDFSKTEVEVVEKLIELRNYHEARAKNINETLAVWGHGVIEKHHDNGYPLVAEINPTAKKPNRKKRTQRPSLVALFRDAIRQTVAIGEAFTVADIRKVVGRKIINRFGVSTPGISLKWICEFHKEIERTGEYTDGGKGNGVQMVIYRRIK